MQEKQLPQWWTRLEAAREWADLRRVLEARSLSLRERVCKANLLSEAERCEAIRNQGRIREIERLFDGSFERDLLE